MENKNVYMTSHGSRIRDSFFKLEPNVRVYMNCSDTLVYVGDIAHLLILKNNILKKNEVINYVKLQKTFNIFYKMYQNNSISTGRLLIEIKKKIDDILKEIRNKLNEINNMIDKKMDKIKEVKKKSLLDKKVENELKKKEKKLLFMKNMINKFMDGDHEKLKFINKNLYERVKKYKKMYLKYNKSSIYMDYAFEHLFGFKRKGNEKLYLNAFNMCVYSGNLNKNIKKYIRSYKLLDLNICPNIYFMYDDKNDFRAYISELPIKMEIRNNNNEIIVNSENIVKIINKFFQKTLDYKKRSKFYLKGEEYYLSTTSNIYNNRNLILLYKNVIMEYKKKMDLEIDQLVDKLGIIKKELDKKASITSTLEGEAKAEHLIGIRKLILKNKEIYNMMDNIYYKYKILKKSNHHIYINKNENELFYPLNKMDDCNIKETLGNVINSYIKPYIINYDMNKNNEEILFRYYDVRKRKYMNVNECLEKQKKEFAKYHFNNLCVRLRDLLIYLYNYYGLDKNKDMKLDVTLTNCIGEFSKEERIYKSTRLRVDEYYEKKYNINGKNMTLREYDNEGKMEEIKKIKKSCYLYKVEDGCPSHCDIPYDMTRKTCVVKGRKKYVRKHKFLGNKLPGNK